MQDTLNQILLMVGEIKGDTSGMKEEISRVAGVQRVDSDRLAKLEHKSAWITGMAAGVSAVVSFVWGLVKGS
jgi:hypothetical protein